MTNPGFYEFLDAPTPTGLHSFYWPVAPGDWWSPNFSNGGRFKYGQEYDPGDVVEFLISDTLGPFSKPTPGTYLVSIWGGDDTYLSMNDAGQTMSTEEVKKFLRSLPNPVSKSYLKSLTKNGKPLFLES